MEMEKQFDVVLVTDDNHESLNLDNFYERQIHDDDQVLIKEFDKRGIKNKRISWSHESFDWSLTKVAIIRTTWDYFERYSEFAPWLNSLKGKCIVLNSLDIIEWNIDKIYLKELQVKGVNIPATQFIEQGSPKKLSSIFRDLNWEKAVLKPNISGAARHTYVIDEKNVHEFEDIFTELISKESMMIQEFQNSILEKGEVSFMVINGQFTHAILKKAKKGDFRVQDDFGGTIEEYLASEKEIANAESIVQTCGWDPLYARVDIIWDNQGQMSLSELELIEPELWFRSCHKAGEILVDRISNEFF